MTMTMTDAEFDKVHKRTAVLVVHGIGSQRALETVRGVVKGVWLNSENPYDAGRRLWSHPQRDGADIDLTVMTTNEVPESRDKRAVDFHELYWAHLMSETKPVAVLLWLYELCRKGPIMKEGINGLWWVASIFLSFMNLSLALLALKGAVIFAQVSVVQNLLVAPFLLIFSSLVFGFFIALKWRAFRLIRKLAAFCVIGVIVSAVYFGVEFNPLWEPTEKLPDAAELATIVALPTLIGLIATYLLTGEPGLRAFWRALLISLIVAGMFVGVDRLWHSDTPFMETLVTAWPWGLNSPWSAPVAFAILGIYLIVNAAFLQPYLGDAARYFRASPANVAVRRAIRVEAVNALHNLHQSGYYDRIIVVAHSLGTVVAYDMLRAYFSRICRDLPPVTTFGTDFDEIDTASWQPSGTASAADKKALREKARRAVASIAAAAEKAGEDKKTKTWLVTDFVTLGSALSHATFLMCIGNTRRLLESDFCRRVAEREFPTCPPKRLDNDGLLTFRNPKTGQKQVHHGALFGLTRWTNIFFPMVQIFWGDAIGGKLAPIFGSHIVDYPVATRGDGAADFFTHTAYWDVCREPETFQAPHVIALQEAIDLADIGKAVAVVDSALASNAAG
ncbi:MULTISPECIES: hypothetical protein [unclassified Bradyrhizobium]|uniref:hypothetical protein n=1 Tax=unclassified Bradyrhizobium TaxID=2631580 RepID=UPI002FF3204F